jgi:invasion protein IalB
MRAQTKAELTARVRSVATPPRAQPGTRSWRTSWRESWRKSWRTAAMLLATAALVLVLAGAGAPCKAGSVAGNPMTLSPLDAGQRTDPPSEIATHRGARSAQANPAPQPAQTQAPPPPPVPQRTEILRFDNWTVTCLYFVEGPKKHSCSARLQVQVQQSGTTQTLMAWTVYPNESNQFVTDLQTPTGVSIAPGVQVEFDKKAKRTLAFDSCDTGHCTAVSTMDNAFIHDVSTAQAAEIAIHAQNGQTIQFNIPLKGFDKAYAQLKAPRPESALRE